MKRAKQNFCLVNENIELLFFIALSANRNNPELLGAYCTAWHILACTLCILYIFSTVLVCENLEGSQGGSSAKPQSEKLDMKYFMFP